MKKGLKNKKTFFSQEKKRPKKQSKRELELGFQLKEFTKLQKDVLTVQPVLSIREYQKKKKRIKNRFNKKFF